MNDNHVIEQAKIEEEHCGKLDSIILSASTKISDFREHVDSLERGIINTKAQLKQNHEKLVAEKASAQKVILELKHAYESNLKRLSNTYESKIDSLCYELESHNSQTISKMEKLEKDNNEIIALHERFVEKTERDQTYVKERHEKLLSDLHCAHSQSLGEIEIKHKSKIQSMQTEYSENMAESIEKKKEQFERELLEERKTLEGKYRKKIKAIEVIMVEKDAKFQEKVNEINTTLLETKNQSVVYRAKLANCESQFKLKNEQFESLNALIDKERADHKLHVTQIESKLKDAKAQYIHFSSLSDELQEKLKEEEEKHRSVESEFYECKRALEVRSLETKKAANDFTIILKQLQNERKENAKLHDVIKQITEEQSMHMSRLERELANATNQIKILSEESRSKQSTINELNNKLQKAHVDAANNIDKVRTHHENQLRLLNEKHLQKLNNMEKCWNERYVNVSKAKDATINEIDRKLHQSKIDLTKAKSVLGVFETQLSKIDKELKTKDNEYENKVSSMTKVNRELEDKISSAEASLNAMKKSSKQAEEDRLVSDENNRKGIQFFEEELMRLEEAKQQLQLQVNTLSNKYTLAQQKQKEKAEMQEKELNSEQETNKMLMASIEELCSRRETDKMQAYEKRTKEVLVQKKRYLDDEKRTDELISNLRSNLKSFQSELKKQLELNQTSKAKNEEMACKLHNLSSKLVELQSLNEKDKRSYESNMKQRIEESCENNKALTSIVCELKAEKKTLEKVIEEIRIKAVRTESTLSSRTEDFLRIENEKDEQIKMIKTKLILLQKHNEKVLKERNSLTTFKDSHEKSIRCNEKKIEKLREQVCSFSVILFNIVLTFMN